MCFKLFARISGILLLLTFASCQVAEIDNPVSDQNQLTITAAFEDDGFLAADDDSIPETKTMRMSDGKVWWTPGDEVSLFFGSGSGGGSKFTCTIDEPSAVASFSGNIGAVIGGGDDLETIDASFWAVYPYDRFVECSNSSVTLRLPGNQFSAEDTFAKGQWPTIGNAPGVMISFKNIAAAYKFKVKNEGITKVVIRTPDTDHPLAGTLNVGMDKNGTPVIKSVSDPCNEVIVTPEAGGAFKPGVYYYATVLYGNFDAGVYFDFYTMNKVATYECDLQAKTPERPSGRGKFKVMNDKDDDLEWKTIDDYIYIPDIDFRAYCIANFDTDKDGEISHAEALEVTNIDCSGEDGEYFMGTIHSLEGIEYFSNLQFLNCSNFQLHELDLSCNTQLLSLICDENELQKLDVSKNSELVYLSCGNNPISSLDISKNKNLTSLDCRYSLLKTLDVSANTGLSSLICYNNQITSLDVSKNTGLTYLDCSSNLLESLDVTNNTLLEYLFFRNNKLTGIDISKNTALKYLSCTGNKLTALETYNNEALLSVICDNNELEYLDVSSCDDLEELVCASNKLRNLNLVNNHKLTYLNCMSNQLTCLNVSYLPNLQYLNCVSMCDPEAPDPSKNILFYLLYHRNQDLTGSSFHIPSDTELVPDAVDLGDGLLWATSNLLASNPADNGRYFAWGEVISKTSYTASSYKWYDNSGQILKYGNDGLTTLQQEDDAAHYYLGGKWRIPTYDELETLMIHHDLLWTTKPCLYDFEEHAVYERVGCLFTKDGYEGSLFIPAAGRMIGSSINDGGKFGHYWSSDLDNKSSQQAKGFRFYGWDIGDDYVEYLWFEEDEENDDTHVHYWYPEPRETGLPIRPVYSLN